VNFLLSPSQPWLYLLALLVVPAAIAAVLAIWRRPALGAAGTLMLIILPTSAGDEQEALAHISAADVASAVFAGLVAIRVLAIGDGGRLNSWVMLPLVGFLVAGGLATLMAYDPVVSLSGLIRYAQIFVVVPLATYLALQSRRDLWLILGVVLGLGLIEGAIGTYQYFTGTGIGYAGSTVRAVGTFGGEGVMGMAMVVTYAMIAAAAVYAGLQDRRRWLGLLLVVALSFPLAFSLSRGYWIAAVVGVMAILFLSQPRRAAAVVVAGGLALAILAGATSEDSGILGQRFSSVFTAFSSPSADQSVKDRYALWDASLRMWTDHPLTGVGIKNFPDFKNTYVSLNFMGSSGKFNPDGSFEYTEILTPHNIYMLVLAEQGFLGILAFLALFLSLGIAGLYGLQNLQKSSVERAFGLLALGSLACYLTSGLYGDIGGRTMVLNAVLFGCLIWLASGAKPEEPS